jgi:hypothetical protein
MKQSSIGNLLQIIESGSNGQYATLRVARFATSQRHYNRDGPDDGGESIAIENEVEVTQQFPVYKNTVRARIFESKFDVILSQT